MRPPASEVHRYIAVRHLVQILICVFGGVAACTSLLIGRGSLWSVVIFCVSLVGLVPGLDEALPGAIGNWMRQQLDK